MDLRAGPALVADLGVPLRCLSSAVLGGGLARVRSWLCLQVEADYARTDPEAHLAAAAAGLPGPVVGMLTAADVARYRDARSGGARALATVGVGHPLAAAGRRPHGLPAAGTINLLVVAGEPLDDAGLVNGLATVVEAKAQALADAGVRARNAAGLATGTATDAVCLASPPGAGGRFAGPATRVGSDLARAVHAAVRDGLRRQEAGGREVRWPA